jgi:transcription initiation factor TFIIIB Brf1 subunit/transcription initiation factor TFIIB
LYCPKCEGIILFPEGLGGEKVCSRCGLVIDETPATQTFSQWAPEWHSNWNEEDSETIKEWLTYLRSVSCQLNLPNFPYREEAARTIRKKNRLLFRSQKLSKNKRTTVAALIYLILKEYDKSRPIKEISQELSLDIRMVRKHVWLLNKTLQSKEEKPVRIQRKTAINYLYEYSRKLSNDRQLIQQAEATIVRVKRAGGNPVGVAAGALYFASKIKKAKLSKEDIGEAFHISERTVYTNEVRIRKLLFEVKPPTAILNRPLLCVAS